MKTKLFTSLTVAALLMGATACGGASESRPRNAALGPCSGSPVDEAVKNFIATRPAEIAELERAWRSSDVAVADARSVLENARQAGTAELTRAVTTFDNYEKSVAMIEEQIAGVADKANPYYWGLNALLGVAKQHLLQAKTEMDALLTKKAQAIDAAMAPYNSAVKDRDEAHAVYLSAVEAYNRVVEISSKPTCPVLTAGDAEAYVEDVGATSTPTTAPRRQFQFIDEPLVTVPSDGNTESSSEESDSSSTTSSSTTTDATSSTTSIDSESPSDVTTASTLPLPEVVASVEYVAPTVDEILEDVSKRLEALSESPPSKQEGNKEIQQIANIIMDLSVKISTGEIPATESQINVLKRQTDSLLTVVAKARPSKRYESSDDSSSVVRKLSVSVSAAGFTADSDVVFADQSGRRLGQSTANKDGVAFLDVEVDEFAGREVFIVGGRNSAGNVVAVPVLVESDENDATSTSTVPAEDSSTATSDADESDESNSSTVVVLVVVLMGLILGALLIRLRRKRRTED